MAVYVFVILVAIVLVLACLRYWLWRRWGYCKNANYMYGQTAIVTGANSGIGFETARALAIRGATVVLACRDLDKTNEAISRVKAKFADVQMFAMQLDLASIESIRNFTEDIKNKFRDVDLLINNAGVAVPIRENMKTKDGFEINFGVNHLGHFLLTNLLLESLKHSPKGRVIVVSSRLMQHGKIDFDDLELVKKIEESRLQGRGSDRYDPGYCNSKLMNYYFGKTLAERTKDNGIDVYIVCPGFTYTNLFRYSIKWYHYLLAPIMFFTMRSSKQGAQTSIYCATEPLEGKSGQFFTDCKQSIINVEYDKETGEKLWKISEELTGGV